MPVLGGGELEGVLDALDAVVWTADPETLALDSVSGGGVAELGIAPERWLGRDFFAGQLIEGERAVTLAECRAVAADGRPRRFVHRFHAGDGTVRWLRTHVHRRISDGKPQLVGVSQDITERDLTPGEPLPVVPTASWARELLDQLPAIIWTTDGSLHFTGSTGAGLKEIGVKPNQLRGIHVGEYFRVDDTNHPYIASHLRALQGETTRFETEWIGRHYRVCVEPFRADGVIVGVLGCAYDDTDRVVARREREEALQRSESKRRLLEAIVDHAPVGIVLLRGPDFIIEHANPAWQAVVPGKAMVGKPAFETWPETEAEVRPFMRHAFRTGEVCRDVDRAVHVQRMPGGPVEKLTFSFVFVPLRDLPELGDAMLLLAVETTDRVLAQRTVEELAARAQRDAAELQSVLDHIVEGVIVCDTDGRITMVNGSGARLFGAPDPSGVVGRTLPAGRLRHADGRPYPQKELPLHRAIRGEVIDVEHVLLPQSDRVRHVSISAAPIRNAEGRILGGVAVARDVTDRIEFEELKDQFLRVVAHELKTPVAIMKGNAQLLMEHELTAARRRTGLDAIVRGANRIDRIVRDVVDMALFHLGLVGLAAEPVDLVAVARAEVDRAAATAPSHSVRFVGAPRARVHGDRGRLHQAARILIENAIKYSPEGGPITVEVQRQGSEAVLTVRDHGIGIPAAKQAHIYERFYRAHTDGPHDFGGLGVGLYICREIIAHHGGRVWFESEEGVGSAFHCALPLEAADG